MKRIAAVVLFSVITSFMSGEENLNNSWLLSEPGYRDGFVYFSVLNPEYSADDKDEKLIFNAAKEIAKFIAIDLGYFNTSYPMGSFVLNNSKIYVDYDTDKIAAILKSLKPVLSEKSGNYEISAVKIKSKDLQSLWGQYNTQTCPDYSEVITLINTMNPEWYYDIPEQKGYIFGIGVSDELSTIPANVEKADYNAMIDIINTIRINVKVDSYHVKAGYLDLYYLFSQQKSSGSVSGIKIIKRYYSVPLKTAFSLAALKIN